MYGLRSGNSFTKQKLQGGEWFVHCDRSGFRFPSSWMREQWNFLIVFEGFYESRQPQDFVRGIADNQTVPFARPDTPNTFLSTNEVQPGDLP